MANSVYDFQAEIEAWRAGYHAGRDCSQPPGDGDHEEITTPPSFDCAEAWAAGWKAGYSEGTASGEMTEMLAAVGAAIGMTTEDGYSSRIMPAQTDAAHGVIKQRLSTLVQQHEKRQVAAKVARQAADAQQSEKLREEIREARLELESEREAARVERASECEAARVRKAHQCEKLTRSGESCRFDKNHRGRCKPRR